MTKTPATSRALSRSATDRMRPANLARSALRATDHATTDLPTAEAVKLMVTERSSQVYGHVNDPAKHPLYWVPRSSDSEMTLNLQSFEKVGFLASLVPTQSATEEVKQSLQSIVTKKITTSKDEVRSVVTSVLNSLRSECSRDEAFVLHGCKVSLNIAFQNIVREHLGEEVEAYGATFRWMCENAGNTSRHVDQFSGWNLLISINEAGSFHLNMHQGMHLVATGMKELPFEISVMLMAGAHSHEIKLNPSHLLHSGSTSVGTRRLLLRLSLKGQVNLERLQNVNFLNLLQQIADLQELDYLPVLGRHTRFAAAKAAKRNGHASVQQDQLLEQRHVAGKYVCVQLYNYW